MALSQQAQVAKRCKQFCKSVGVTARVKSQGYSMGNSVTVTVTNQPPETVAEIEKHCAQFQYGSFNGMEDIYEYTNRRDDIPQTKYLFVNSEFSDDMYQAAWDWLKEHYINDEMEAAPDNYEDLHHTRIFEDWATTIVHQVLNGSFHYMRDSDQSFWKLHEVKTGTAPEIEAVPSGNYDASIHTHYHTKRECDIHIVVLSAYVDRTVFNKLRASAKSFGGWYSRKWGDSPAGFAFEVKQDAVDWLSFINGDGNPPTQSVKQQRATSKPKTANPEKLRTMADKLQSQIDDKRADRLENTSKRIVEAAHARSEADRLERTQKVMYALANLIEAENLPPEFMQFKTKKGIYDAMAAACGDHVQHGYHSYVVYENRPHDSLTEDQQALWSLLTDKDPEQIKAEQLQHALNEVRLSKISGYFPTPDHIIGMMLDHAGVNAYHQVLEPSAGDGAIVGRLLELVEPKAGGGVTAFEINYTLCKILQLRGIDAGPSDFLEQPVPNIPLYDRVLMNPPFEKLQDIDHVLHAYKFLKPHGRLVAIMGLGFEFRQQDKPTKFREWLSTKTYEVIDIPAGAFKASGTNVVTKMVVIDKSDEV